MNHWMGEFWGKDKITEWWSSTAALTSAREVEGRYLVEERSTTVWTQKQSQWKK